MSRDVGFAPIDVELRDGRRVTVRAIREADADRLQDAIRALSFDSRYKRFFSAMPQLPSNLLERAIHPEPGRAVQLVATIGQGPDEKIIAGTRYAALAEAKDCEFAIAVVDGGHGLGLARRLLDLLIEHARLAGFDRMEGYVLTTNRAMLGLAKRLGFIESASDEGPTVRRVSRELRGA